MQVRLVILLSWLGTLPHHVRGTEHSRTDGEHLAPSTQEKQAQDQLTMDYGNVFEKLLVVSVVLGLFGAIGGYEPVSWLNLARFHALPPFCLRYGGVLVTPKLGCM